MADAWSAEDKLRAVQREIGLRRRVYGRYVAEGRMSQDAADRGIAVMEAIAADYLEQVTKERLL